MASRFTKIKNKYFCLFSFCLEAFLQKTEIVEFKNYNIGLLLFKFKLFNNRFFCLFINCFFNVNKDNKTIKKFFRTFL